MKSPIYSTEEFLSSAALSLAAATASGAVNLAMGTILPYAGLMYPEGITLTPAGFVVSSTLPAPFGILFGNGIFAQAHGTQTNQDTQSYSTNFTSLVPASGSVTAYLLASQTTIQQGPYQVIGPQPGHPDYDPTFIPYTAYAQQVDSLSLSASLTAPDNQTTFELARGTLAAGATGITNWTLGNQLRSASQHIIQPMSASGLVNLGAVHLGKFLNCSGSTTLVLPDLTLYNGCCFIASNPVSGITIQTSINGQNIYGFGAVPGSAVTGFVLPAGVIGQVISQNGNWVISGGNGTAIGVYNPAANTVGIAAPQGNPTTLQIGLTTGNADAKISVIGAGDNPGTIVSTGTPTTYWPHASFDDDFMVVASSSWLDIGCSAPLSGGQVNFFNEQSTGNNLTFAWWNQNVNVMGIYRDGGATIGSPTGTSKGTGTINVATGIYLNGTAYTNPDYVLEYWSTGKIERFAKNAEWMNEANYSGPMSLDNLREHIHNNLSLPRFGQKAELDYCRGGEAILATIEEMYLHIFDLHDQLKKAMKEITDLKSLSSKL